MSTETKIFHGIGISAGVSIGPIVVLKDESVIVARCLLVEKDIDEETQRLQKAVEESKEQLESIRKKIAEKIDIDHAFILEAQILMLSDKGFIGQIKDEIVNEKVNAEWAVEKINQKYIEAFEKIDEQYLRERSHDIRDISRRLLSNLGSGKTMDLDSLKEPSIIVANDLPPSNLSALEHSKVLGFATEVGGKTSHVGLLARSLTLPAVVGLHSAIDKINTGNIAIIDGEEEILIINPTETQINEYKNKQLQLLKVESQLILNRDLPAETPDGFEVELRANVDLPIEAASAMEYGARGIGLFRSEFLFMQNPSQIADPDVHYRIYRHLVEESPYPNTIRILDIGSDKAVPGAWESKELNPALGLRAIRLFLKRKDIMAAQLKGMFKASAYGKIEILVPFISGLTEVYQTLEIINEIKLEYKKKKIPFDEETKIGVMIEIPSAALIADNIAKAVDFFSVGTNDLIQYTLAIDRANENVSHLYRPLHPAIIKLLSLIISAGRNAGIPVSVCGEVAADPLTLIILLGMRYPQLSMNAVSIPMIKNIIRSVKQSDAETITKNVLKMKTAQEAEEYLLEQITIRFPRGFQPVDRLIQQNAKSEAL